MPYPSEYYHYDESELTAVINTVTDEIVLIPLDNPIVQDVAVIIHLVDAGMDGIDNLCYSTITDFLKDLPYPTKQATKNFVVSAYQDSYNPNVPAMTKQGYEVAYDYMVSRGMSVQDMLGQMPTAIKSWNEASVKEVLDLFRLGLECHDMSHAKRLELATQSLKDSERYIYHGLVNPCRPATCNVDSEDAIIFELV